MIRFRVNGILSMLFGISIYSVTAHAQTPPPPVVSPDPIADIPLTNFDPSLLFHDYSWRSFISLNWPAKNGGGQQRSA